MVLQQKLLEKADFIVKITGLVMVLPASSDKWKALNNSHKNSNRNHMNRIFYKDIFRSIDLCILRDGNGTIAPLRIFMRRGHKTQR